MAKVQFSEGAKIFLFPTTSRLILGPTQPPVQCVLGALSLGIKQPGHEADHTPPSTADIKNGGANLHSPYIFMAWCLIKQKYNLMLQILLLMIYLHSYMRPIQLQIV
jgi:hypothetical protein